MTADGVDLGAPGGERGELYYFCLTERSRRRRQSIKRSFFSTPPESCSSLSPASLHSCVKQCRAEVAGAKHALLFLSPSPSRLSAALTFPFPSLPSLHQTHKAVSKRNTPPPSPPVRLPNWLPLQSRMGKRREEPVLVTKLAC